jgi:hypothetical protein
MKIFCIGHKDPLIAISPEFVHVSSAVSKDLIQLIIPDDHFGDGYHGRILSEYCQLFGLARYLKSRANTETLYIFQYRKFLAARKGGSVSSNLPYAYASNTKEAEELFPTPEELAIIAKKKMVGPLVTVESLAGQYSAVHVAEDFSKFAVSVASAFNLDYGRVNEFVSCKHLFPAPSLGAFDGQTFLRHMDILDAAWGHFAQNFLVPREGYQRRVGGFLLERLHSFLIYEDVILHKKYTALQGCQIIVSESLDILRTT